MQQSQSNKKYTYYRAPRMQYADVITTVASVYHISESLAIQPRQSRQSGRMDTLFMPTQNDCHAVQLKNGMIQGNQVSRFCRADTSGASYFTLVNYQ